MQAANSHYAKFTLSTANHPTWWWTEWTKERHSCHNLPPDRLSLKPSKRGWLTSNTTRSVVRKLHMLCPKLPLISMAFFLSGTRKYHSLVRIWNQFWHLGWSAWLLLWESFFSVIHSDFHKTLWNSLSSSTLFDNSDDDDDDDDGDHDNDNGGDDDDDDEGKHVTFDLC